MNIIIDHLDRMGYSVISRPRNTDITFPWISLSTLTDDETVNDGWINVCDAHDVLAFLQAWPGSHVICIFDGGKLPAEFSVFADRLLAVEGPGTTAALFTGLRDYFLTLVRWESDLRAIVLRNGSYTELLHISEGILENFISMSDSSFSLVGYTTGIPIDDPVSANLIAAGHHESKLVQEFEDMHLLERWRDRPEFLDRCDVSPICIYPTIDHVFHFRRSYFIHVVMVCNNRPITSGLEDLFKTLVKTMSYKVRQDWVSHHRFDQPHDHLIDSLISESYLNDEDMRRRASILKIPFEGSFALCLIELLGGDELGLEQTAWQLVDQLPSCKVTINRGQILLLETSSNESPAQHRPFSHLLNLPSVSSLSCDIGISNPFHHLNDLAMAYRQSQIALRHFADGSHDGSADEMDGQDIPKGPRCQWFEDCLCPYLLSMETRDVRFINYCLSTHPLWRIHQDDLEHGTENLRILDTFLKYERRATQAAECLHMHRNNVIYHIEKMERTYHLDLDDEGKRFELLLISRLLSLRFMK